MEDKKTIEASNYTPNSGSTSNSHFLNAGKQTSFKDLYLRSIQTYVFAMHTATYSVSVDSKHSIH